jgi:hypothetical protein
METTLDPKRSQRLWESILYDKDKESIMVGELELNKTWMDKVYDIVSTNRAKSKGTVLNILTDDNGDIQHIDYQAVKIKPEEIPKKGRFMET